MIGQYLRHYSMRELASMEMIKAWQQQGFNLRQQITPGRNVLHFITDTGWEGLIDLENWFSLKLPQDAKLASGSWPLEQLEALFVNCRRPIEGLPQELDYQYLESKGLKPASFIKEDHFACQTPQGRVWLHEIPQQLHSQTHSPRFDVNGLPVRIQFRVGISKISNALFQQMQTGDVLLINQQHTVVVAAETVLGQFIRTEEGFMFDENENTSMYDDDIEKMEQLIDSEVNADILVSRNKVNVKLGFVLQQNSLSIAELEAFYCGKVLLCDAGAENNMIITANGVNIAKGELVWIEDRLGVEIKEMYQEVGNGSR